MSSRSFRCTEDSSDKFWKIEIGFKSHCVWFGRCGTDGQMKIKDFASQAEAQESFDSLVREKTKKGYIEISDSELLELRKPLKKASPSALHRIPDFSSKPLLKMTPEAQDSNEIVQNGKPLVFANFNRAFTDGHVVKVGDQTSPIKVQYVDSLMCSSGKLSVGDPNAIGSAPALEISVPTGAFPVFVSQLNERIAAAVVVFASDVTTAQTIARWEPVFVSAPDAKAKGLSAFGVDAGCACFLDHTLCKKLADDEDFLDDPTRGKLFATHIVEKKTGRNTVVFSTGWGDGVYCTYWGLTAEGAPVCLAVDCNMLVETEIVKESIPGILSYPEGEVAAAKLSPHVSIQLALKPSDTEVSYRISGGSAELCDSEGIRLPYKQAISGKNGSSVVTCRPIGDEQRFPADTQLIVKYAGKSWAL